MAVKTRRFSLSLAAATVLLAGSLAGCSSNGNGNGNGEANGNGGSKNGGSAPAANSAGENKGTAENEGASQTPAVEPITYTMNTTDEKMTWDTPITKAFTDKTGVSFKYDLVVGDETQKQDLWLAAGDYPDIMTMGPAEVQKYKDGGALVPLNELIDKYGPHIKEKFGEYFNLLKDADGNIWSLYGVNKSREAKADAAANFIIQYDVLKEAGYPLIKTLDQLYDVVKAYKDKHPQIDNKETIGFSGAMTGWQVNIQYNNPIISASGLPDHGNFRIDGSGNVTYNPVSDDAKTYYAFLNKLYQNGLYDKEAFSQDDLSKKLAQGRVLAAYAPAWMVGTVETQFRQDGHPERAYARLPIYFNEDTKDISNTVVPTFAGSLQWAVTKSAKNPERFIQFVDYLFSEEGQILSQWGIEGKHYEVKDGHRVLKPEEIEARKTDPDHGIKEGFSGNGTGSGYWFNVGDGAKLDDGDYATPLTKDYVVSLYDDMTKDVLSRYGKTVWADFLPKAEVVPGYLWQLSPPENITLQAKKIEETWKKFLPKLVMAKNQSDFDKSWDDMKAAMDKAGLRDVDDAYTKLWADFNAKFAATIGG
ncbi:extracellular solute-binding protein [Paenibacillus sp. R14(2021)]|uniref:extracellular solute-binding protein n=1 Tax=Paenibacillus sp. R14(2021) TaxID=2859228 RepID=UPI001C61364A|nr:extracellular solute-binding protein [Paenibacillus sp. R14(2021)]